MSTLGVAGRQAPAAFSPGVSTCSSQNRDGICSGRWGSLASSGLPVMDFLPFTAQLLLAPFPASAPRSSAAAAKSSSSDGPDPFAAVPGGTIRGMPAGYGGSRSPPTPAPQPSPG